MNIEKRIKYVRNEVTVICGWCKKEAHYLSKPTHMLSCPHCLKEPDLEHPQVYVKGDTNEH